MGKAPALPVFDKSREAWLADDHIQTRLVLSGAAFPLETPGPNLGKFWLIDRIVVPCSASGGDVASAYLGSGIVPANIVASAAAATGELAISLTFDAPLEVAPGEVVTIGGSAGAVPTVNVFYRLRHIIQDKLIVGRPIIGPPAEQSGDSGAPTADGNEPIRTPPPPPQGYAEPQRHPIPDPSSDPTYR